MRRQSMPVQQTCESSDAGGRPPPAAQSDRGTVFRCSPLASPKAWIARKHTATRFGSSRGVRCEAAGLPGLSAPASIHRANVSC